MHAHGAAIRAADAGAGGVALGECDIDVEEARGRPADLVDQRRGVLRGRVRERGEGHGERDCRKQRFQADVFHVDSSLTGVTG